MNLTLDIGGWRLDLLLLLLLLLELLLGAIGIGWLWNRIGSGYGITRGRVHGRSEIRMGKRFSGGDTFGGIKLQQTFQQVNCCRLVSIRRSRIIP